jgi:DNA-binding NarL/FixJ family response regulator
MFTMHILIADDHPIFRSGLKFLLESLYQDNILISEVANGKLTLEKIHSDNSIDLCILDIDMPEMNGLEVCRELKLMKSSVKIIILTMHKETEMLKLAIHYGVNGYLIKDNTSDEMAQCISEVMSGNNYYSTLVRAQTDETTLAADNADILVHLKELTKSELKTLKLVGQKLSSREIADLMFVSVKSVENYRSRICKKLNLDARNNSLLLWVIENKTYLDLIEEF